MIKISKGFAFFTIIAFSMAISSCVQDDDFSVPEGLGTEENKALEALLSSGAIEISMVDLKTKYTSNNNGPVLIDTDVYIKAYVSSSDKNGNFFKELFLQNAAENPSAGIKVIVNQVESYNQYNMGREVYIKLNGLYVGEERVGNGVVTIGGSTETNQFGTTVERLTENQRAQNMFRSENTLDLVPLKLNLSQVNSTHIGIYTEFSGVEFSNNLEGKRYFDPAQDFDTLRLMQSCTGSIGYSNFNLETSSFAAFKDHLLPIGNGTVRGVIARTFDGSKLVVALNDISDITMTGPRCSPVSIEDFSIILNEDFESMPTNKVISGNGWTSYAEVGTLNWKIATTTDIGNPGPGNKIAAMKAYNSGTPVNIAWLITPPINLNALDKAYANFISSNSSEDGSELELLISSNWDGTADQVTSATWKVLPATIVSDDVFYQDWVDSGLIDLSPYSGTIYIAFKYIGGDNSGNTNPINGTIDGTFEVDNFKILDRD
ncbi:hypothetical protein LX77_01236 [Gelidibacter algens]|uniref:DUF5689 domain-containing protein n=1 Tax=Gelidibacter algens TaxID=49280 RepID=A0A1A7QZ40_9FLAO|nr:DUF5689 domain-containing protein [Gelidibacter algens]OBX25280.1 hypothetical protein A9996_10595 [Gelidibacter algens]RAJ25820.1 hypothetical protein LX77_01236 [Gelidibacter algens]